MDAGELCFCGFGVANVLALVMEEKSAGCRKHTSKIQCFERSIKSIEILGEERRGWSIGAEQSRACMSSCLVP